MDRITRVTAGQGGDAHLITGDAHTALIDTGMAYCAPLLIHRLEEELSGRPLDYLFLSHSHYDHSGALPFIRRRWPQCRVLGAEYAQKVLGKDSARALIRELSRKAALQFDPGTLSTVEGYSDGDLCIDAAIADGDRFDLGGVTLRVIATPGHTRCSLSFFLEEPSVLFSCETTGVLSSPGVVESSYLTSLSDSLLAVEKCRALNARHLVLPHTGETDDQVRALYWDWSRDAMIATRDFILDCSRRGFSSGEIFTAYEARFRTPLARSEQPDEAFRLNTESMIRVVLRECLPESAPQAR